MKQRLRARAKGKKASPRASVAIQRRLLAEDWWTGAFQVGLYRSTPHEPATDDLLADLLARRVRVAVPAWRSREYGWDWVDETIRWKKGPDGILEPAGAKPARTSDLRVVVVPGLAFDASGGRLGHGAGHFDRLLAKGDALRVGLCFENRLVKAVPMEAHDIRMDVVITEKRVIYLPTAADKLSALAGGNEA